MLDFWNVDHVWSSKILRNQGHKRIPASGSWHFARAMSCLDHCSTNNRFKVGHVHHVHWFMFSYDTWTVDIILWSTDLPGFLGTPRPAPSPSPGIKDQGVANSSLPGSCKNPEPFQMVFSHVIVFFPLIVFIRFSKRWLHTFTKGFTWARKGKRKRKSKGRERKTERNEKEQRTVSHTDHFWYQKLLFSLSFCYRS